MSSGEETPACARQRAIAIVRTTIPGFSSSLREAAVHVGADGIAAEAEKYLAARLLDQSRQLYVFQQTSGHGGMSADCVVGIARHQKVLPVGRRCGRLGIAYLRRPVLRC